MARQSYKRQKLFGLYSPLRGMMTKGDVTKFLSRTSGSRDLTVEGAEKGIQAAIYGMKYRKRRQ